MGYTKEEVAAALDVPWERVRYWVRRGYLRGAPGRGSREGYSSEFIAAARAMQAFLDLYPRGPLENWRDRYSPPPDWEDDDENGE